MEFSGSIVKSVASTLNRNISLTIQVRKTIYTAFERGASELSNQFLNCWAGGPLARAPCAQSFLREVLRWRAASPHWLRTLRQNFARVVSLLAFQHVSKPSEAALTKCWHQWVKRARNQKWENGKSAVIFFEFFVSFSGFRRHHVNIPWKGAECYAILSESLIQEFALPYGGQVPLEVRRS